MAYNIKRSDPSNIDRIVVDDKGLNTTDTSISLVGQNKINYGEAIATTQLHLLENFASPNFPKNPIPGQLWYDNNSMQLKVNIGIEDHQNVWASMLSADSEGRIFVDYIGSPERPITAIYGGVYYGNLLGNATTATTATMATKLATSRTINGTNFNGEENIITASWGTSRQIKIGSSTKAVNGSTNITWSLTEIGASPLGHTHPYAPLNGSGTSGTWPIGITGNASTSTTSNTAITSNTSTRWATPRTLTIGNTARLLDGTGNVSWTLAEIGVGTGGIGEAPSDGKQYGRQNTGWTEVTGSTHSHNEYALKTGVGSTGTWPIGITGNAASATTATNATNATNATKANTLTTARTINGTSFDGSAAITTANWGTSRTLTIGSSGKGVDGSGNIAWSLAEIGAAAASHTHPYAPLTGTGTSGTWPISITGNAATATTATNVTGNAGNADKLGGFAAAEYLRKGRGFAYRALTVASTNNVTSSLVGSHIPIPVSGAVATSNAVGVSPITNTTSAWTIPTAGTYLISVSTAWTQGSDLLVAELQTASDPNQGPQQWVGIGAGGGEYNGDGRCCSLTITVVCQCGTNQQFRLIKKSGNTTYHRSSSINISRLSDLP